MTNVKNGNMEAQECETKTWKNGALCKMFLGTYNINLDLVLFVCLFVCLFFLTADLMVLVPSQ